MRCAFVLALVTGCGFQVTPGGSAVQDGSMPDDNVNPMIDAMIDAPIDAMIDSNIPVMDQDGDTIADTSDNCIAVPNTNQRNHDNDPFGDACDRCPHLLSQTDPDGDGDGVGDACDPRPGTGGDMRVLWAGFYDASEVVGWGGQGTFTVNGGYLQQVTANTSGWAPPGNVNVPFVMTEAVIDTLINTNGSIGVAVNTPTNNQFECTVAKGGSNIVVRSRQQGGDSDQATWPGTFATNSRITFRFDMATDVDCRVTQGTTANVQQVSFTNSDQTGQTYVGTDGIAARFDYLFVVDEAP